MKGVAPQSQGRKGDGGSLGQGAMVTPLRAPLPRPKHPGSLCPSAAYVMPQHMLCAEDCGSIHPSSSPSSPPSLYPSVLPTISLCPAIPLAIPTSLHTTASCPAPRLPALSLLLFPSIKQEQVLPAPRTTGFTPQEWWMALLLSSPSGPLSNTFPHSPWLAVSLPPTPPGKCPPLAPSALG